MLSLGVSFADVSVTGTVNLSVGNWKDDGIVEKNDKSNSFTALGDRNLASGDSLLTFAGSEDLGDGLKASFKFEPRVNISGKDVSESAQKGLFGENREAWIGLSGAFGTVHLGNNYTPLFLQSGSGYDPNGFTNMTVKASVCKAKPARWSCLPKQVNVLASCLGKHCHGTQ